MKELTGFQRDLLYIVASKSHPHGLSVKKAIEEYYNEEVNHGRLYPNLNTLAEEGYLKKGEVDARTNYYMITEKGEEEIRARERWEHELLGFRSGTYTSLDETEVEAEGD